MERIGHRGAKRELPENSLAAFVRAFERHADAIELDVHATRDGVVVVHHDSTLSAGAHELFGRPIANLDWRAFSQVEIAPGVRVPTLDNVLRIAPPASTVYVEIKGRGIEGLVARTLAAWEDRCAVHSFDHEAIARMRELAPRIPRGILLDGECPDIEDSMRAASARDVWQEWTRIDRDLVDRVHGAGGRVIAWTVNRRSSAEMLIALSVDGVCTDDVRLLDGL